MLKVAKVSYTFYRLDLIDYISNELKVQNLACIINLV